MKEETLFQLAMQESLNERAAFLEKMCGDDQDLRQRVAAMLQAADNPAGAHEQLPATLPESLPATDVPEGPGTRLGPYQLLELIGEGGMGAVYLAEQQEPIRRHVALKIIKPGVDVRSLVIRFQAERQALALMDHPNIARVLDAGTAPSGRPYIVMELVAGAAITRYCDGQRLTPRQRLELFLSVCRAVQHAHQKGIIHRDLKPSNVLVALYDGKPVPKVIDFGLAKATGQQLADKTRSPDLGGLVGTLRYMSPEQAEAGNVDIDTRSDVYSLGVILYELLTGTTPLQLHSGRDFNILELLHAIREEQLPRPSKALGKADDLAAIAANRSLEARKLSRLLRGDLDSIVMKCLEKDRNQRYETANGLALDVQRYLEDEPVQAHPSSVAYRLRKFARRHRAGLWTATLVSLLGMLALGGVGWALWDRAARHAEAARSAELALTKVEQLADKARQLPSDNSDHTAAALVIWRQAEDVLAQGMAVLSAAPTDDALQQRAAALGTRLEEGRQQTERRHTKLLREEQLFRKLEEARMSLVWLVNNPDHARAAALYAAAFAAYGLKVPDGNTEELALRILAEESHVREALILALYDWAYHTANLKTKPTASDLRALAQRADNDAWRKRYGAAVDKKDRPALLALSSEAQRSTLPASSVRLLGGSLHRMKEHKEALALLRWGRRCHPTDFWLHFDLGTYLGDNKDKTPLEIEEAHGCFLAALALRPDECIAHNNFGNILVARKQWDAAIVQFQKALAVNPSLANAHDGLGNALQGKELWDAAIAEYHIAIDLDPPQSANARNGLGNALMRKRQWDEAIVQFKEAIRLEPEFAEAHNDLGLALHEKQQWDEAIAEYRLALKLRPRYANAHHNLGLTLASKKQWDEAITENRLALNIDPGDAIAHNNLGLALHAKKQWDEAIAEYQKAIQLDPRNSKFHNNLGNSLRNKQQLEPAIAAYRKAIEVDPKYASPHYNLANALWAKYQIEEAVAEFRKAIDLQPDFAEAHCNLGHILRGQGELTASLASLKRGHELGKQRQDWTYPSEKWVADAERLVQSEEKLGAFVSGKTTLEDNRERLALLEVCRLQQRHVAAARLYSDAFAADQKMADDLKAAHRFRAACVAVKAAGGQGKNADTLDERERSRLRQQALAWLRADLELWRKLWEGGVVADRQLRAKTLQRWQDEADLAGVRDPEALKKLPDAEQEGWRQLWTEVTDLRKQTDNK